MQTVAVGKRKRDESEQTEQQTTTSRRALIEALLFDALGAFPAELLPIIVQYAVFTPHMQLFKGDDSKVVQTKISLGQQAVSVQPLSHSRIWSVQVNQWSEPAPPPPQQRMAAWDADHTDSDESNSDKSNRSESDESEDDDDRYIQFEIGVVFVESEANITSLTGKTDRENFLYSLSRTGDGHTSVGGGCWASINTCDSLSNASMGLLFPPFAPGNIKAGDVLSLEICPESDADDRGSPARNDVHAVTDSMWVVMFRWNGTLIPVSRRWRKRRIPDHLLSRYHLWVSLVNNHSGRLSTRASVAAAASVASVNLLDT